MQALCSPSRVLHPCAKVSFNPLAALPSATTPQALVKTDAGIVHTVNGVSLRSPFTPPLPPLVAPATIPQVLVKTDAEIVHTVKGASPSPQGFFMACAELWAFSLTDYHVLTRKSGYGKVGAMVNANGEKHIFTIDFPMQVGGVLWANDTARAKGGRA